MIFCRPSRPRTRPSPRPSPSMSKPTTTEPKLSLKVVMDKGRRKVLFAEANADFVNVLLSFLALPLGKAASILAEAQVGVGSLTSLYKSLFDLDDSFFSFAGAKRMLLDPQSSLGGECRKLALDITDSPPANRFYVCPHQKCDYSFRRHMNISIYPDLAICECRRSLNKEIHVPPKCDCRTDFIANPSSFVITDDLNVRPITHIVQILNNLGYADTQGSHTLIVSFGINELKDLLKLCLMNSATPLTDMINKKTGMSCCTATIPKGISTLHHHHSTHEREDDHHHHHSTPLKVCLQRSTNKFLFAVAKDEFVDLLFSLLTVPLGGVEFLLDGETGLRSIDNLYRSVSAEGINEKYFRSREAQSRLMNPKLAHGYMISSHRRQFLPLAEEAGPQLYWTWKENGSRPQNTFTRDQKGGNLVHSFKLNRNLYVQRETMCIVTDDLTITPTLAAANLNRLGLPLSDVKEMDLQVGHKQALNILKASLTSKTALTDALIKPFFKQERNTKHALVVT